jgi:hypothetical protein
MIHLKPDKLLVFQMKSGPAAAALLLFSLSLPVLQPKENIPS